MNQMKSFLSLYSLFIIAGAFLLINFSKEEIFLWVNHRHFQAGDTFFYWITHLGDGLMYPLLVLALAFIRYRYAIIGLASFIVTGSIVQILKHLVFADTVRPIKHFEGMADIYTVPGLEVYTYNSFPSGHAAIAFGLFCLIALLSRKYGKATCMIIGIVCFALALAVGISRVYLAQHFFIDVYAGSFIGVIDTLIVYWYFNLPKFNNTAWYDKSLKRVKKLET